MVGAAARWRGATLARFTPECACLNIHLRLPIEPPVYATCHCIPTSHRIPHPSPIRFPLQPSNPPRYNILPDGRGDWWTEHAGCPIVKGRKWITNSWIHERSNEPAPQTYGVGNGRDGGAKGSAKGSAKGGGRGGAGAAVARKSTGGGPIRRPVGRVVGRPGPTEGGETEGGAGEEGSGGGEEGVEEGVTDGGTGQAPWKPWKPGTQPKGYVDGRGGQF
jgi:hypothetical protein